MKIYEVEYHEGMYDDHRQDTVIITTCLYDIYDCLSKMTVSGYNKPYQLYINVWENGKIHRWKNFSYILGQ